MKKLPIIVGLSLLLVSANVLGQKLKVFQTKIFHYDHSALKGIVFDVSPQGIVLLDTRTVSAMSAKNIQEAALNNQLPSFTVPFNQIRLLNIKRRGAAGKGFGLGYLASFVTLETIMAASVLSSGNKMGCDGSPRKATLSDALIGASCAAPPGILVIGLVSFVGSGLGGLIGSIPVKQISLDSRNPEIDARQKLKKYALLLQTRHAVSIR